MLSYQEITLQMPNGIDTQVPGLDVVYEYLRKRGVSKQEIEEHGLRIVPARELIQAARGGIIRDDPRLAIVFPHADPQGRPLDWWSARLVDAGLRPAAKGWAGLTETKLGKMFCPPNEPPHGYLVPSLDWTKLQHGDKIYIHESCIKAINGARLGYWSIGLNGVWGFTSKKHGVGLIDELRGLPWKALELNPVIVFDSNADDNWDVRGAISALAQRLHAVTGQRASHLLLPRNPGGDHWGFDDYVVHMGDVQARAFLDGEAKEVEISEFEQLRLRLNDEVCVVRSLGRIAEQDTGTLMTRGTFTEVNYAHFTCEIEDKKINVPKAWLMDERRVEVECLKYVPGGERISVGQYLNLWRGMGVEPAVGGSVQPWVGLLALQVPSEALRKWLIQWFAYPLQTLGAKLNTYVHLYGPSGTGKNGLLAPLIKIYGDNGVVIGKDQIGSTFNSVYATRQFVNIDEIHGGTSADALAITNRIKLLTTSPTLTVNRKGEPEYMVDNHVNLVTTSNYSDSIKLDEGDRRACVIQFGRRDSMLGKEVFDNYFAWVDNGGAEALYEYLLGVDLSDFDAKGWAPFTEWKEMVTDATRGPMEKWVRDLWDDPDSVLPRIMRGQKVFTPEQIGLAYSEGDTAKNTLGLRNAVGKRMQDLGFKRVEIKIDGNKVRAWIVGGRDREWSNDEIRRAIKVKDKY